MSGITRAYANLYMSENSLKDRGYIDCSPLSRLPFYTEMGWQTMVHEVLHRFGAVDIYNTGTVFGYDTTESRTRAELIDPRAQESIMGDKIKDCMEEGGYETDGNRCTEEELDKLYLDIFNKQQIGIMP